MKNRLYSLNGRGVTIIDVLIVLAILGLSIGVMFATIFSSLQNSRESKINLQAMAYAEQEIENIRYLAVNSTNNSTNPSFTAPTNIFAPSRGFCIKNPSSSKPVVSQQTDCMFGSQPFTVVIYNCDYLKGNSNACMGIPAFSDSFVVIASWQNVRDHETNRVTLSYRAHARPALLSSTGKSDED